MKKGNKWVIILGGLVIITLVIISNMHYNRAVNDCVRSGQKENICREGLR